MYDFDNPSNNQISKIEDCREIGLNETKDTDGICFEFIYCIKY